MNDKTFLIMAGGTGGHVFPALATAKKLLERNDHVVWLGSIGGMEQKIISEEGIKFYGITIQGIRGKGLLKKLVAPFQLFMAVMQAIKVVREVQPDAVLGMGGFASGPGGIAARVLGKPLLIHEQNAVAGMTNRILSYLSTTVMSAFPNAFNKRVNVKLTGNPIRDEICSLYYQADTKAVTGRKIKLLVLGGSLGAASLNDCVPNALASLDENIRPEVWHQTGRDKDEVTKANYLNVKVDAKVSAFISDMAEAYRWADFVICRAGALTVSEICVAGLGAILVPYPHAVDDHQTLNATEMVKSGAAWLLPQADLNKENLSAMLKPLLLKKERIAILSMAAHKLAIADAAEKVANECRRVCYA